MYGCELLEAPYSLDIHTPCHITSESLYRHPPENVYLSTRSLGIPVFLNVSTGQ
jgi:hypothetical protein